MLFQILNDTVNIWYINMIKEKKCWQTCTGYIWLCYLDYLVKIHKKRKKNLKSETSKDIHYSLYFAITHSYFHHRLKQIPRIRICSLCWGHKQEQSNSTLVDLFLLHHYILSPPKFIWSGYKYLFNHSSLCHSLLLFFFLPFCFIFIVLK